MFQKTDGPSARVNAIDHYATLHVAATVSLEGIQSAYARRSKEIMGTADGVIAAAAMDQLNEAYAVLAEPERRAEYDRSLGLERVQTAPSPPQPDPLPPSAQPALVPRRVDGARRRMRIGCLGISIALCIVILGGILLVGRCVSRLVEDGRVAVDEFHLLYEEGDYEAIYETSDESLQHALTGDEVLQRLGEVRTRLGSPMKLSFSCLLNSSMGDVETLRVEYLVTFEKGEAWETYEWRRDEGNLRLLSYAVETEWEDGTPDWEVILAPEGIRPNASTCTEIP